MTQEQKKSELAQHLVTKGIVAPADVEANIVKMAGTVAEATVADKGLTTDIDKAYEAMLIEKGMNTPPATQSNSVVVAPTESLSAADSLAITKTLAAQRHDRNNVSANTTVEKLVFDRPAPTDHIPAGTTGVISAETWKAIMDKFEGKVCADDDECPSMTNFNALKAAAENGTPVAVFRGKLNTKSIGFMMNLGSTVGSGKITKPVTREAASNFLVLEAAGYVLAGDTTPGLKLRYIKPKNDPRHPGKVIEGKTVLAEANKKAAIEAGNYVISREVDTTNVKEVGCKSELCFKVDTGKPKSNGQGNITRLVRVTVKASIPQLVRKAEFVEVFGTDEKVSNSNLQFVPEGKSAANISAAQKHAIAALRMKLSNPDEYSAVQDYADKLKAFEAPQGSVTPGMVI
jgi:hypothetical protein